MLKERAEEINNHAQSLRGAQQETSFLYTMDEFEKRRKCYLQPILYTFNY